MRILLTVFLVIWSSMLRAETFQHGNIIYSPPPGWSLGGVNDGIQTLRSDLPDDKCEYCYIYLAPGAAKSGSLAAYMKRSAPLFVDEDERDSLKTMQEPTQMGEGKIRVELMALIADGDPLFVVGYELRSRFELIAFKGNAGYEGAKLKETQAVFSDQIVPMFSKVLFVSEGAKPLMPAPVAGDLSGVYWGWYSYTTLGLDGMIRIEMDHRRLVFWNDGTFFDGTPPMGLQPMNLATLQDAGIADFGTYVHKGGKVVLSFANGSKEELQTNPGGSLQDSNRELFQVTVPADGAPLVGTISSMFYSGFTPGSGVEGGVSASSSTTFMADGSYTGSSFGGAFGNFTDGGGNLTGGFSTGGDKNKTGGRYEIKDGLLIQYPADGTLARSSMVIDTKDGIMIEDQFLSAE